jgi:hypothetical protein
MSTSSDTGVHATHCCVIHGCKYGDTDCPVTLGTVSQVYHCEFCPFEDTDEAFTLTKAQLQAVEDAMSLAHGYSYRGESPLPDLRELDRVLDPVIRAAENLRHLERIISQAQAVPE